MEDDPEFSIEHHAIRHELADGLTEAEALAEMMEVFQKPLDREHPLWEIHSYENMPGNRTAIVRISTRRIQSKAHKMIINAG